MSPPPPPSSSSSSSSAIKTSSSKSLSSHLAILDLKSRILSSLSKLSDRDTHHIAAADLQSLIPSLSPASLPLFLSALLHDPTPASGDLSGARPSPAAARRETLRLLSLLCSAHPGPAATHLPRIIGLVVRRLRDPASDSALREACGDAVGSLAGVYVRPNPTAAVAGLFVRPLVEVMGEESRVVQAAAAVCLGKVVEGGGGGGAAFQRLCPRLCKMIGSQSFLAKGSLLSVLSNLSQVHSHSIYLYEVSVLVTE